MERGEIQKRNRFFQRKLGGDRFVSPIGSSVYRIFECDRFRCGTDPSSNKGPTEPQDQNTLATVHSENKTMTESEVEAFKKPILEKYNKESHAYYSSARLWDDGVIKPADTRKILGLSFSAALKNQPLQETKFGVFRMWKNKFYFLSSFLFPLMMISQFSFFFFFIFFPFFLYF